ncbi:DUF5666 domain-containing protein [Nitrosomonas sp.]|uniref:DUF5666 domain-containing protein n=1 Tax=Nitrosomonas sp. TaxID=42353 RepID=UPI0025E9D4D6|nr:DUF5666 domain-containing protein [Nitrosomonas sp.]MBY0484886.1 hypothetical protein [Nitrosomonas sp.]
MLVVNYCDNDTSTINPVILANSGIGGTGATQSGIGRTGLLDGESRDAGNLEGGIGGTGIVVNDGGIGGTGIIGIITGLASICVNGIELYYGNNTLVSVDGRLSTTRDLAVGQVIAARSLETGHQLAAQSIAIIHAAVGPISFFNAEMREMRILGQIIQVDPSRDHGNFSNLETGDWVQVSGHRLSNGTVVSSRIEVILPLAEAKINGYVTQIDAQGFEVNGTRINHDANLLPVGIAQGMEVLVAGYWDGVSLNARHIQTEPTRLSIGNVEHVVIEGYIHATTDKELNLSNRIIILDPSTQIAGDATGDLKLDQLIQISGRLNTDQRISAERIELVQQLPVQIQERNERSQVDGSNNANRDSSDNESDVTSFPRNDINQSYDSGFTDSGSHSNDAPISSKDEERQII